MLELRKYLEYDFATPMSVSNILADVVRKYKNSTDAFTEYGGEEYGFWKDRDFRFLVVKRKKQRFNIYVSDAMFFPSVISARVGELRDCYDIIGKIPKKLLKRYPTMYKVGTRANNGFPVLDYCQKTVAFRWTQKWEYSASADLPQEILNNISDFVSLICDFMVEWRAFKASRFYVLLQEMIKKKKESMAATGVFLGLLAIARVCWGDLDACDGLFEGDTDGLLSAGDFGGDINFDGISDSDISNFFNNDVNSPSDDAISNALTSSVDGNSLGDMLGASYEPSFGGNLYNEKALDVLEELKDNNIPLPDSVNLSSDRSDYIVQSCPDGGFYSCDKILIKNNIDTALENGTITEQVAERLKDKVTGA